MKRTYLDHAATTPLDPDVLSAMDPFLKDNFGNPSSIHDTGHRAHMAVTRAREQVADVLGARPNEIIFTSGGTESDNLALKGAAEAHSFKGHLITTAIEHHAVLHTAQYLEKRGMEVTYLEPDSDGFVSAHSVTRAIREDTRLVSIMYANNEIGTVQPIAEIGNMLSKRVIAFHTDAVQAGGALSLNVKKLHVDLLSLSGHKFYGPKGIGALYVKQGTEIIPQQLGGGQELKRRASTENVPGIIGFAEALARAEKKREQESQRLAALRDVLFESVRTRMPEVISTGSLDTRLPNNVSLCVPGIEGEALVMRLSEHGFDTSSGSACTSGNLDPSHVLQAIGLPRSTALGSLRVTLGASTSPEDIEAFVAALETEVTKLRKMSPVVDVACR